MSEIPTVSSNDESGDGIEFVLDIDPENAKLGEFAPDGFGVTVKIVPGDSREKRLVITSGVSLPTVERLLMTVMEAIEINWEDGTLEEAGEKVEERPPRLQDRIWMPWMARYL